MVIMKFSEKLKDNTKDSHKTVDNHPFVKVIKTNEVAGTMYIVFNQICINSIQKSNLVYLNNDMKQKLLRENIDNINIDSDELSDSLKNLLERCDKYPLEHSYMFVLGLLMGGAMLKRFIPEKHHRFLAFENHKEIITDFKTVLDNVPVEKQDDFVKVVNESYTLIKTIFDEFNEEFN